MAKSIRKERFAFDRACAKALAAQIKGTAWKKTGSTLFRQQDGYFFAAKLSVWVAGILSVATFSVKPMALDPLFWDIVGFADNKKLPLSFRATGAFVTSLLPQFEAEVENAGDEPAQVAARFLEFCDEKTAATLDGLRQAPFLEQLRRHPNQVERGAYAIDLVVALIAAGRLEEAAATAEAYAAGQYAVRGMYFGERNFHEVALDWLKAGGRRP